MRKILFLITFLPLWLVSSVGYAQDIVAQKIHIGSNVTTTMPSGLVNFESGTYNIKGGSVTLYPGTCINRGSTVKILK